MTDEWLELTKQLIENREREREMLSRVRGIAIHECCEDHVIEYAKQVWLKRRVKDVRK